jgi:hypothetical protein
MKRLITCASLVAVGAASVDAQPVGEPSLSKLWSVSAKLRGFYDDNYNTAPDHPAPGYNIDRGESWGFSVAPSIGLNLIGDQTTLNLRYDFDLRWYESRSDDQIDMYHSASINLDHRFNERYRVELYDQFAYADEPSVIESNGQQSTFYRSEDENLRNYGGFGFFGSFTENWGYRVGYENTLYDYSEEGAGSRSALLDRMENKPSIDFRRVLQPNTVALVGYSFTDVDYTGDEYLSLFQQTPGSPMSDFRNSRNHFAFAGLDHSFTQRLDAKIRVGAQIADYYNADQDELSPYADAMLGYTYAEGSRVQLGVKTGMIATDVAVDAFGQGTTLGADSTTTFLGVNHRLTSRLNAQARGMWQTMSYFGESAYDGESDNYYSVDVGLTYTLNTYIALEGGYLWDRLDSDIPHRSFSRNRGYLGVRATY